MKAITPGSFKRFEAPKTLSDFFLSNLDTYNLLVLIREKAVGKGFNIRVQG